MSLYQHPPEIEAAAWSHRDTFAGDILVTVGFTPDVAQVIANDTSTTLQAPITTGAFIDSDCASLFVALHSAVAAEGTSWIELSVLPGGLRLRRSILQCIALAAFEGARVDHLVMWVVPADLRTQRILRRLRFRLRGEDDGRLLYALRPSDLPPRFYRPPAGLLN